MFCPVEGLREETIFFKYCILYVFVCGISGYFCRFRSILRVVFLGELSNSPGGPTEYIIWI